MTDRALPRDPTSGNWVLIGTRDAPERALVDGRGRVTPEPAGWSLDWWIGADDRWHLAASDVGVRQRLVGSSPVVETAMRIPGGDALERVYAVRASADEGGGDYVVVEIENRSPLPAALALAVRPANPLGPARVSRLESVELPGGIDPAGGPAGGGLRGLRIDGRLGLVLPREPSRSAIGSTAGPPVGPDCLDVVLDGDARDGPIPAVEDPHGSATAAVIFPLAHKTVFQVLLPLPRPDPVPRSRVRSPSPVPTRVPDRLQTGEQVAKGWQAQTDRGLRVQLPDSRLEPLFQAARRWLLSSHVGTDIVDGSGHRRAGALAVADLAPVVAALSEMGLADEAADVLAGLVDRAGRDGSWAGPHDRFDANGSALWAVAHHWSLHRDRFVAELLAAPVAEAARWITRQRRRRSGRRERSTVGLLPDGTAPAFARGPRERDARYRDDLWGWLGQRRAALMLTAVGQERVGTTLARDAADFGAAIQAGLAAGSRSDTGAPHRGSGGADSMLVPLGPGYGPGLEAVANLDVLAAGVLGDEHRALAGTLDALMAAGVGPGGVPDPGAAAADAVRPALTAWMGRVELAAGRTDAAGARLRWLVEHATEAMSWPEVWSATANPGTSPTRSSAGSGVGGAGFDVVALAAVCSLVRDLLVREVVAGSPVDGVPGLALASWVPADWYGQGIEVHDAPTAHGRLSFAVRWHGDRPALLWELVPHESGPGGSGVPVRLTVPGLDPAWSTTERAGDTLLDAVPVASAVAAPVAPRRRKRRRDPGANP